MAGVVLRADALQIARRRVARAAPAGAVEVRLAGLRIADDDVEDLVEPAVGVQVDRRVEKRREIGRPGPAASSNSACPWSGRPARRNAPSCLPFSSSWTSADRVRSGPLDPPRAFEPWQKPHWRDEQIAGPARRPPDRTAGPSPVIGGRGGVWARRPSVARARPRSDRTREPDTHAGQSTSAFRQNPSPSRPSRGSSASSSDRAARRSSCRRRRPSADRSDTSIRRR